jgi:ribonuclease Z
MVNNISMAAKKVGNKRIEKITIDILNYHTSPVEAAEIARDAKVAHLLYNHIVPPLPFSPMEKLFIKGVKDVYSGGVTVGRDGTLVSLEANKDSIAVSAANNIIGP